MGPTELKSEPLRIKHYSNGHGVVDTKWDQVQKSAEHRSTNRRETKEPENFMSLHSSTRANHQRAKKALCWECDERAEAKSGEMGHLQSGVVGGG